MVKKRKTALEQLNNIAAIQMSGGVLGECMSCKNLTKKSILNTNNQLCYKCSRKK